MLFSDVPFIAKSFATAESGPLHWLHGYVSGDDGAERVNSSRQVARLYVGEAVEVEVATAEVEVSVVPLSETAVSAFSLVDGVAEWRLASRDTQTPTTTEQTMRTIRAIII